MPCAHLSTRQLYLVAQLLTTFGVADQSLFQLKALIDSPMTSAHALVSLMSTNTPVVAAVPVENVAITPHVNPELKLILLKQCDDKTVYHKILKPYPTLELVGADNPEVYCMIGSVFCPDNKTISPLAIETSS